MAVRLIGVPTNSAGRPGGVARAPAALRAAGLVQALRARDGGDVVVPPLAPGRDPRSGLIAVDSLAGMVESTRRAVRSALDAGLVPFVAGGDCPILLGCLAGARDARGGPVGLLFLDGHEDTWPPHASTTGEAADCELGLALGRGTEGLPAPLADLLPLVAPGDVALLGPRDAAAMASEGARSLAAELFLVDDRTLLAEGCASAARRAAARLHAARGAWWLHLDLDVLSTEALPAVDYLQPGGLGWADLEDALAAALAVPGLLGMNLTIYNPDLDPTGAGARRIVELVRTTFGASCRPRLDAP